MQLHDAGHPALRRLPRQRRRAVAAAASSTNAARLPGASSAPTPTASCPTLRDPETLARPWAMPGTPGLEHRIGGLEKQDVHRQRPLRPDEPRADGPACARRRSRASRATSRRLEVDGDPTRRRCWSSAGAAPTARSPPRSRRCAREGRKVAHVHLRHLNPLPPDLGEILRALQARAGARAEPGPARCCCCAREFLVDASASTRSRASRSRVSEIVASRSDAAPGARVRRRVPTDTTTLPTTLTQKDFETDQDVRWCPGCGDYAILAAVQKVLPELGIPREKHRLRLGIGCSSRFPYYMNTYGFHTIHGRAPAIATGLKLRQPGARRCGSSTGDGDALSIGGNHLIHALRRNVDVKILLFNNRIYGLTKGQYSPTSELGKATKSTPARLDRLPVQPAVASRSAPGATFVARIDRRRSSSTCRRRSSARGRSTRARRSSRSTRTATSSTTALRAR